MTRKSQRARPSQMRGWFANSSASQCAPGEAGFKSELRDATAQAHMPERTLVHSRLMSRTKVGALVVTTNALLNTSSDG
jgi:hypothetical protein